MEVLTNRLHEPRQWMCFMNNTLIIGLLFIWSFILIKSSLSQKKRKDELNEKDNDLLRKQSQIETKTKQSLLEIEKKSIQESLIIANNRQDFEKIQNAKKNEFERLLNEAMNLKNEFEKGFVNGRNWLSDAYSEYIQENDNELECSFIVKPNPAYKSAEIVSALKISRIEMAKKLKLLEYQLKTYEEYFPQLLEYKYAILEELVDFQNEDIYDEDIQCLLCQ